MVCAWAVTAGGLAPLAAAEKPKDIPGSRFTYIHRLAPMSAWDPAKPISLKDDWPAPFSWRASCTKCHEYETIRQGWHFSAPDPKADPGRPGEPWFWVDRRTATQLPLSYRAWPHTYRPSDVGLTNMRFVEIFGRDLPGGGPGELPDKDNNRWVIAGKLEINCAACHSGDPGYDNIEYYLQIAAQNLQWAPTATSDFATVTGAARSMPDSWMPEMPPEDEATAKKAPTVVYDKARFDSKGRVFWDLPSDPPDNRCYFCHSLRPVGETAPEVWQTDRDVHTRAGLSCSTCHRHGLDHKIRRGYEGEPGGDDPHLATLTCRGCHLGAAAAGPDTMGGRLGAPVPLHAGIPTVHFEKLACTTCHSGLYPRDKTQRMQTSRAHALEFQGDFRGDDALPFIAEPVFARNSAGIIGPNRMVWPAFFGYLDADMVKPLSPDAAYAAAKDEFETRAEGVKGLNAEKIAAVLAALAKAKDAKGEAVYVAGGNLYRRAADGSLSGAPHAAAEPVSWPIGHDVRPKGRSLGSGGCTDCHGFDSPIAFGQVVAETPADLGPPVTLAMYEFQGRDPLQLKAWAMSYLFRPMFKVVGFTTAGVIAAVLLLYVFVGLAALARWAARKAPQGPSR
jgi:hypothetical protein